MMTLCMFMMMILSRQVKSPFPMILRHRDACVHVQVYDCLNEERPTVYIKMQDMRSAVVPGGCKTGVEVGGW